MCKKVTASLVAATIFVTSGFGCIESKAAAYDTTAPIIESIYIGSEYSIGDTINVSIDITEEETGVSSNLLVFDSVESNQEIRINCSSDDTSLSGTYTGSYVIPENACSGEWVLIWAEATDAAGNKSLNERFIYEERISFYINNELITDTTAPEVQDWYVSYDNIKIPDSQVFNFTSSDDDIDSIIINAGCTDKVNDKQKVISSNIEVNEDGLYSVEIPYTEDDLAGNWSVYGFSITDQNNNTREYAPGVTYIVEKSIATDTDATRDDIAPTIDSIESSETVVLAPAYTTVSISGTEETSDTVNVSFEVSNKEINGASRNYNTVVEVVDGIYNATCDVTFDSNTVSGTYYVSWIKVSDSEGNVVEVFDTDCSWKISRELDNKEFKKDVIATSLSNTNLIDQINSLSHQGTANIIVDTNVIPAEVFEAIFGTNRTLIFDRDGIQWIFRGPNIHKKNIKDVDIYTSIYDANIEQFGYNEGATGTIIQFADNGILPGKAEVRIKEDYISKKYNLNSSIYVSCIKETLNNDEYNEVMNNEEAEDYRYVLVESTATYEDGYVSIHLNHNSSYILSNNKPYTVTTTPKEDITNNMEFNKEDKIIDVQIVPADDTIEEIVNQEVKIIVIEENETTTGEEVASYDNNIKYVASSILLKKLNIRNNSNIKFIIDSIATTDNNTNRFVSIIQKRLMQIVTIIISIINRLVY